VLAQAHLLAEQPDQARAALAEASAMAAQMGNFDIIPICESQLAWLAMDRGEWPEAAERLELALAMVDQKRLHDYSSTLTAFVGAARLAAASLPANPPHRRQDRRSAVPVQPHGQDPGPIDLPQAGRHLP
jgi:hypothetical protein